MGFLNLKGQHAASWDLYRRYGAAYSLGSTTTRNIQLDTFQQAYDTILKAQWSDLRHNTITYHYHHIFFKLLTISLGGTTSIWLAGTWGVQMGCDAGLHAILLTVLSRNRCWLQWRRGNRGFDGYGWPSMVCVTHCASNAYAVCRELEPQNDWLKTSMICFAHTLGDW